MITYDRSDRTVVVLCVCGWRTVTTRTAAEPAARRHVLEDHVPDELLALERDRVLSAARSRDYRDRKRDTPISA